MVYGVLIPGHSRPRIVMTLKHSQRDRIGKLVIGGSYLKGSITILHFDSLSKKFDEWMVRIFK